MGEQSLWLGPLRRPMRFLMIGLIAALGLVWLWLVIGVLLLGSDVSMSTILRPGDHTIVRVFLWLLLAACLATGLYLSDTRGAIEVEVTGPLDILSLILGRLAMIAVAVVVGVMFYEVVARYVFFRPTLWANEMSLWIAGFVFLLAGLYAMQQRSHIRIYVIYDLMPRWAQKLADTVTVVLIWVFFASLVWGGYNEVLAKLMRMETFGTAWDPPIPSTVKTAILAVIGLVALQATSNLIADWHKAPEHHAGDEVDEQEIEHIRKALGTDGNG
ncbi:TRAP-type mannitol/chloroaromatic compound transport system, small permease component [Tistlia consotensis]|uniref:TRAP transporter small permease protein n=2 Tax=Tistlia TaxID=1321364 RepID=A0A1Y6B5P3_9PROT|nr:TRAP-type mannitol/chloroaromatic compound transport system, small permease component [Tistlia consotensis USBA 355]SNR27218.1 TRAP-type mannitol/chloroaromatic compound transport system, small permease component [Tistlia consotensis]